MQFPTTLKLCLQWSVFVSLFTPWWISRPGLFSTWCRHITWISKRSHQQVQLISAMQSWLVFRGAARFLFKFSLIFERLETIDLAILGVRGKRERQWTSFILRHSNESWGQSPFQVKAVSLAGCNYLWAETRSDSNTQKHFRNRFWKMNHLSRCPAQPFCKGLSGSLSLAPTWSCDSCLQTKWKKPSFSGRKPNPGQVQLEERLWAWRSEPLQSPKLLQMVGVGGAGFDSHSPICSPQTVLPQERATLCPDIAELLNPSTPHSI